MRAPQTLQLSGQFYSFVSLLLKTLLYSSTDRPLQSFIVSQLLLSFLPLLLFTTFALSTVAFSLGAAVVFALFWISVAFMLLVPTLLVTSSIAVLVWGWAVGSFLVARWLYRHAPVAVQGDMSIDAAGRKVDLVKGENGLDASVETK
jgi:hypothetical protein